MLYLVILGYLNCFKLTCTLLDPYICKQSINKKCQHIDKMQHRGKKLHINLNFQLLSATKAHCSKKLKDRNNSEIQIFHFA